MSSNVLTVETGVGRAEVVDLGGGERRLTLDEEIHGQVNLENPTRLAVDYQSRLCQILVALEVPHGGRVLHIGGGAFAVPRALQVHRPDLTQTVVERSGAIIRLAERSLGLRRSPTLVVRKGDGRAAVRRLPDDAVDVVVGDAFVGQQTPPPLMTVEFLTEVRRAVGARGIYVVNIVDEQPWSRLGAHAAAAETVFDHIAAVGSRGVARLVDPGNVFLLASAAPLPAAALRRAGAVHRDPFALVAQGRLTALARSTRPRRDSDVGPAG
ncbi:spermidine synthase [Euzebya tangerina]|uniref:spermidine synthase n=1 Tax=Euzebya tangerina TaxID=591198 RepID=UPI000E31E9A4|nr:fused MFS/spermidine synthase [Euzebya tangerina]